MILIPYDTIRIHTSLSIDDAAARLAQVVDSERKWFQWQIPKRTFNGSVSKSGFRIMRNIVGRTTYLPLIRGRFEHTVNGTNIFVTFSLHPLDMMVLVAFFLSAEIMFLYYRDHAAAIGAVIVFIILLCVFYTVRYLPEKKKAEGILRRHLRAHNSGMHPTPRYVASHEA